MKALQVILIIFNLAHQIFGQIVISNQLEFTKWEKYDRNILENWTDLSYQKNSFQSGLRYEIKRPPDPFIYPIDTLLKENLRIMHLLAPRTMIVSEVYSGRRFVNVKINNSHAIEEVEDHPDKDEPALATIGIYTMQLDQWHYDVFSLESDFCTAIKKYITAPVDMLPLYAIEIPRTAWLDVGTVESYQDTVKYYTKER